MVEFTVVVLALWLDGAVVQQSLIIRVEAVNAEAAIAIGLSQAESVCDEPDRIFCVAAFVGNPEACTCGELDGTDSGLESLVWPEPVLLDPVFGSLLPLNIEDDSEFTD